MSNWKSWWKSDVGGQNQEGPRVQEAWKSLPETWPTMVCTTHWNTFAPFPAFSSHEFFNHNPHIFSICQGNSWPPSTRFMTAHWWLLGKLLVDLVLCWSRLQNSWWEKDHTNLQICNWQIPNFWRHLCRKTATKIHSVCWTWLWPQQFHHTTGIYKLQGVCLTQSCVIIHWQLDIAAVQLPSFSPSKRRGRMMSRVTTQGSSPFSFSENNFRLLVLEVNSSWCLPKVFRLMLGIKLGSKNEKNCRSFLNFNKGKISLNRTWLYEIPCKWLNVY